MDPEIALKTLESALKAVDTRYIAYHGAIVDNDLRIAHTERCFAYELYYQWRRILNCKIINPEGLILNAEITKHIDPSTHDLHDYKELIKQIDEEEKKEEEEGPKPKKGKLDRKFSDHVLNFPDMILHGGNEDLENQVLICEIKRRVNQALGASMIMNDLAKLGVYMHMRTSDDSHKDISFKAAAFIVSNTEWDLLKQEINNAWHSEEADSKKKLIPEDCQKKIMCYSVSSTEGPDKVHSSTLYEIIK